ncbi:response regulator [Candidatus Woesearchaeota archaeon]|nr:response regulator [Candidatus Woesearchaeota archaeon]
MQSLTKILQLEDDEQIPKAVARILRREGIEVELATNYIEAEAALRGEAVKDLTNETGQRQYSGLSHYDAMLLDMNVPSGFGSDIARTARAMGYQGRIVMFSGADMQKAREQTRGLENVGYLNKPYDSADLLVKALIGEYSD